MIDEKKLIEILRHDISCFEGSENKKDTEMYVSVQDIVKMIEGQPQIGEWIPCSERLPEEHDSIFAKFKGTDKWNTAMFEKISDEVNITAEYGDGTKKTLTAYTIDGKWKLKRIVKLKVIAWRPFPEPYKGSYQES